MLISVILSTFNQPAWLEKVLHGYEQQTDENFEILIADDGSGKETLELINCYKEKSKLTIKHVWHEDDGFRKCTILNKAVLESDGEYLLFSDGDCVPRADFIATHRMHSEKGYFLSGGMYRYTMDVSKKIMLDDIDSQKAFDINYLKSLGQPSSFFKDLKISAKGKMASFMNFITPTNASWNGHNSSGWKSDILYAKGFDQRMKYGGEDRELGERLFNKGIKSKQLRYSAICTHLEHSRGYVTEEDWSRNNEIRKETRKTKRTQTEYGIIK